MTRRKTRQINVGAVKIGGFAPITVQSMTNTKTTNVAATVEQIKELEAVGCELVRLAVPDKESARAISLIKKQVNVPLIADVHFDYRLALEALSAGVDGLRINPGTIGGREKVVAVVTEAAKKNIPLRIGINAASLEDNLPAIVEGDMPAAMVESALQHVRLLEDLNYRRIKISLKSSEVPIMIQAYRMLADRVDYPLHVGVTEAGTVRSGAVKSAVGIGVLLSEGIGDTIRVSLTGHPREEVRVGFEILRALGLRKHGVEIISCPTCARTQINLVSIAEQVEERLLGIEKPLKVAVMGCSVNGPGEAKHADLGIAGGKGVGLLFRRGEVVRTVPEAEMVDELVREVEKLATGQ